MYQLWNKETNKLVATGSAECIADVVGCNKVTVYRSIKKNANLCGIYEIKRADGKPLSLYKPRLVYNVYDKNENEILTNAHAEEVMALLYISRGHLCKLANGRAKNVDGYTVVKIAKN